ncbi:amino acid ABC transporter substrate-binding protein [Chachezhania sediminis]|uniref:amino acid ABC transporter substrate-binding protein n=1 Tax=Chachezhania sediminis TaxID=2599291 RepID=UPI00131BDB27|nr:amino acid ABC transporter substrate-binding protein [Chachezhania sediminis]
MRMRLLTTMAAVVGLTATGAAAADLLDEIKDRGELTCGTLDYLAGVGYLDDNGNWSGFDVDFCKAASAAIFGTPDKVKFVAVTGAQKFPVLASGEIDILSRSVTATISRDTTLGFDYIGPNMLSGQGLMVHKETGATDYDQMDGATICVLAGTVTERYLADYFAAHNMSFTPVAAENGDQLFAMYFDNRCDAVTMEPPYLAIRRNKMAENPEDHVIFEDVIAKSFEAPFIREGSPRFYKLLQWMHYGMVTAEELGVTKENVDDMVANSTDPRVQRLLGVDGNIGADMGVANDWMVNVIKAVGNYGEFYDNNLGANSPLQVPRGLNALVRDGGAMTAPGWQ